MRSTCLTTAGLCILLTLAACNKRVAVVAPRVPASPPPAILALEEANRAFAAGDYVAACREYENFLQLAPSENQRDLALFRLGLAYALRKSPGPDWQRATQTLQQLMANHATSPYRPAAELILNLHTEVGQAQADARAREDRLIQLSTELDRLKRIDAERGRRP